MAMFDNADKKKTPALKAGEASTTIIGQGVFIEGRTFKGLGTVRVDGVYMGEMFVDGHVVVGQTGEIRGNITSNTMVVAGTVTGNIVCREEIHVTETALIEGDIQTNSLVVDQGAGMSGTVSTRRKAIVEPINLDDAVKSMGRKSIEMLEERTPSAQRNFETKEEKVGFFK